MWLELFWRDGDGTPYRTFSALADSLTEERRAARLRHQWRHVPDRLHARRAACREWRHPAPSTGPTRRPACGPVPNFYKKPNGVFYLTGTAAGVLSSEDYRRLCARRPPCHPVRPDAGDRGRVASLPHRGLARPHLAHRRRGLADGMVHFAISLRPRQFPRFRAAVPRPARPPMRCSSTAGGEPASTRRNSAATTAPGMAASGRSSASVER
jgi:hypothetical protein